MTNTLIPRPELEAQAGQTHSPELEPIFNAAADLLAVATSDDSDTYVTASMALEDALSDQKP